MNMKDKQELLPNIAIYFFNFLYLYFSAFVFLFLVPSHVRVGGIPDLSLIQG